MDGIGKREAKFRATPEKDKALVPPLSPQDLNVGIFGQVAFGQEAKCVCVPACSRLPKQGPCS